MKYQVLDQIVDPRGHFWYLVTKHETEDSVSGWAFFRNELPGHVQCNAVNCREVEHWDEFQALVQYIQRGHCSFEEVRSWPYQPGFQLGLGDVFLGAKRGRGNHSTIASRRANRKAGKVLGH
jgi:hypothetical protein